MAWLLGSLGVLRGRRRRRLVRSRWRGQRREHCVCLQIRRPELEVGGAAAARSPSLVRRRMLAVVRPCTPLRSAPTAGGVQVEFKFAAGARGSSALAASPGAPPCCRRSRGPLARARRPPGSRAGRRRACAASAGAQRSSWAHTPPLPAEPCPRGRGRRAPARPTGWSRGSVILAQTRHGGPPLSVLAHATAWAEPILALFGA